MPEDLIKTGEINVKGNATEATHLKGKEQP